MTIRGLHFQAPPHAQDKLVRCTRGAIMDVAVVIRVCSETCGASIMAELSAENCQQLFIPMSLLNGFLTLSSDCEVQYKCSDYYALDSEKSVHSDIVSIDWPLSISTVLSAKDASAANFANFQSLFKLGEM